MLGGVGGEIGLLLEHGHLFDLPSGEVLDVHLDGVKSGSGELHVVIDELLDILDVELDVWLIDLPLVIGRGTEGDAVGDIREELLDEPHDEWVGRGHQQGNWDVHLAILDGLEVDVVAGERRRSGNGPDAVVGLLGQ